MTLVGAASAPPERCRMGPIAVDRVTLPGALERIEALVRAGRGGTVFTPNVDHVVLADRHPELREAYRDAELCLADGMPLVWASRLLGAPLPARVTGADLVVPLAERAAARGWSLYLLGGAPGVAAAAAERLRERFPQLRIAGTDAPRIRGDGAPADGAASEDAADESDTALERLAAARADLVLVALGAPKQELWIHRNRGRLRPAVAVGVGASLDFVAGRVRRAPAWVGGAGLEWLWRLLHEPRRLWRRYLVQDPRFAAILLRELQARRRRAR